MRKESECICTEHARGTELPWELLCSRLLVTSFVLGFIVCHHYCVWFRNAHLFSNRSAEMPGVIVQLACFCLVPKSIFLKVCEIQLAVGWQHFTAYSGTLNSLSQQGRSREEDRDWEKSITFLAFKYANTWCERNYFSERITNNLDTITCHYPYNFTNWNEFACFLKAHINFSSNTSFGSSLQDVPGYIMTDYFIIIPTSLFHKHSHACSEPDPLLDTRNGGKDSFPVNET